MKFYVIRTSAESPMDGKDVEINTLEELIAFYNEVNIPLILDSGFYSSIFVRDGGEIMGSPTDCEYSLEIYDAWRE